MIDKSPMYTLLSNAAFQKEYELPVFVYLSAER